MKKFVMAVMTVSALASAALGLASAAAAFPGAVGNADDTVRSLEAEGYRVQLNGRTNNSTLSRCIVTGVHPTLPSTASLAEKRNTTVFVDVSCPDH